MIRSGYIVDFAELVIREIYLINQDFQIVSYYMIKLKLISILKHKYRSPLSEHSLISQYLVKSAKSNMYTLLEFYFLQISKYHEISFPKNICRNHLNNFIKLKDLYSAF